MEKILVFLILIAIVIVLFTKPFEGFQNTNSDVSKFKGSVHVRGRVNVLANDNQKVKFDKLCIKDSKTGLTSCIDSQKMAYLVNNRDHRLKLFCLGNTCISKNHLDILHGKNTFKLRDLSENECLSTIGNKNIHWRESWKYAQHDDNDDARQQLLQNPITYAKCQDKKNVNFKLEPINGDNINKRVNVPLNESSNVGYKSTSDNYIRAKPSKEQKVAFST
jgi:hypothetical protein